jgi:hypothetical protein
MNWISKMLHHADNDSRSRGASEQNRVVLKHDRSGMRITGDNPIRTPEDDALGRTKSARCSQCKCCRLM